MATVKSHIRLRSDTLTNWITNNPTLVSDELSIVKVDNTGAVNFKIGNGSTYNNTDFIKFNKLRVGNGVVTEYKKDSIVVDSEGASPVTLTLPSSSGTLATTDDITTAIANIDTSSSSSSSPSSEDIVKWNYAYNRLNQIQEAVADMDFEITDETTVGDVASALLELINIIKKPETDGSLNDDDTTVERLVTATCLNPDTATTADIADVAGMNQDDNEYGEVTTAISNALGS